MTNHDNMYDIPKIPFKVLAMLCLPLLFLLHCEYAGHNDGVHISADLTAIGQQNAIAQVNAGMSDPSANTGLAESYVSSNMDEHPSASTVTLEPSINAGMIGPSANTEMAGTSGIAGMIGSGATNPGSNSHPPLKPESWHKLDGDVMALDEAWGRRIKPRGIFEVPGGIGLLYNSKPPDSRKAAEMGIATHQTGSLAFSNNLVDWVDYPGNPVMRDVQEWQGSARAMPRAVLYDEPNEQWVVYFGDAGGDYEGIRAIGASYSSDLVNWTADPEPTMTVVDYANMVADHTNESADEIIERGRVYATWAIFHEGKYYLRASAFMFVSDNPGGPFELYEGFQGDLFPSTRPVYWDGVWYTVFPGEWDGQRGFGLAWSDNLMGPYTRNPKNPIFTVETTTRSRPQLLRYGGIWAVLYCHQHNTDNMPLRLAVSRINPDIIPGW